MATNYELRLFTPAGAALAILGQYKSLQYALAENAVGALTLVLPPVVPLDWFQRDSRIEVWRSIDGAPAYCEGSGGDGTQWFIRRRQRIQSGGETLITLTAYDAKHLLKRRIVNFYAGSAQSTKTDYIDDMMKAVVRENFGSGVAGTGRDISAYLDVQADTSQLPSVSASFAWQNVLSVMQEMCNISLANQYPAMFDVVKSSDTKLEFRTYFDVRGVYRGFGVPGNALYVSTEFGTLSNPTLDDDWSNEITYVMCAGAGEGALRITRDSSNDPSIGESPFNRLEKFLDARDADETSPQYGEMLQDEAIREVLAGRPRLRLTGSIVDVPGARYGVDYRHGDIIAAVDGDIVRDSRVTAVKVTVDASGERVDAQVSAENVT